MPLMPALLRQRQADLHEFESAWSKKMRQDSQNCYTEKTVLKNKTKIKQNETKQTPQNKINQKPKPNKQTNKKPKK